MSKQRGYDKFINGGADFRRVVGVAGEKRHFVFFFDIFILKIIIKKI
jgi:hypothetical protein